MVRSSDLKHTTIDRNKFHTFGRCGQTAERTVNVDSKLCIVPAAADSIRDPIKLELPNSFENYNQEVARRLTGVAAAELAARAFNKPTAPQEPTGFGFRFCLPGPSVLQIYQDRRTDQLVAFENHNGELVRHSLFD